MSLLTVSYASGLIGLLTSFLAYYLRAVGAPESVTDRIEGFSRICNGIAFALTICRFGNPFWVVGGFIVGLDEIIVGVGQLINGGRRSSPIESFLQRMGMSSGSAAFATSLSKAVISIGPRTIMSALKLINWAKNVRSFAQMSDDVIQFVKMDYSKIMTSKNSWDNIKNYNADQKMSYLINALKNKDLSVYSWRSLLLGADKINTGPTVGGEFLYDGLRAFQNLAESMQEGSKM